MHSSKFSSLILCLFFALGVAAFAQEAPVDTSSGDSTEPTAPAKTEQQIFLESLVGSWEGTCRTWLRPGELFDESEVRGQFELFLGGPILRHTYESKIDGKARKGEETIAFNPSEARFEISWVDDFHMSYGILFSKGDPTPDGFVVAAKYRVAPDQPAWGWKTVYQLTDDDHLTITAYNVLPDGREGKAVETSYVRQ